MSDQAKKLKSRFAISPLFDAEIDVAGFGAVALSPDADHELRLNVTAAALARFQGYRSMDYVKKRYLSDTPEHTPRDLEVRRFVNASTALYDKFYRSFPPRSGERIGVFAFDLAFVRSYESVKLLYTSARQGFLLEPCLMARSLVEQFAYAVAVWHTDEDAVIFGTKPQGSIRALRPIQPKIGKAYGLLSEMSHYHPNMHYSFIGDSEALGEFESSTVLQRSWVFKILSLAWVFYILDLQFRVFEHCYGSHENFSVVSSLRGSALDSFDGFFQGVPPETIEFIRELIIPD